jgi:peptide-methionine (S)-S-oxide reductase
MSSRERENLADLTILNKVRLSIVKEIAAGNVKKGQTKQIEAGGDSMIPRRNRVAPRRWLMAALALPMLVGQHSWAAEGTGTARQKVAVEQKAVFAGGCFWGVDAVFKHVKGVDQVVSGYSGGQATTAKYEVVSTGSTGQAESVEVTYNPDQVSYQDLLAVFFNVAHDPTELNRQGPDTGSQYRSAIFYMDPSQQHAAQRYIDKLDGDKAFPQPIVTQVVPFKAFYPAEEYHQNFLEQHPDNPYIVFNDLPKLDNLKVKYPQLYQSQPIVKP